MRARFLAAAAAIAGGVALVTACGSPTTFGTPLPHAPGHWPAVTIENHTGWPVQQAAAEWGVPVQYGTCVPWASCIRVTEVPVLKGTTNYEYALTTAYFTPGRPALTTIQFSDVPAQSYNVRLETACHELGHAFGLGHDNTGGCMEAVVYGARTAPSAADITMLHSLYGVR